MSSQPSDNGATEIDWAAALETALGDEALLDELVGEFLRECPVAMDEIVLAIEEADATRLRRSAHKLKGSLRIFVCPGATECAWQLEQLGKRLQIGDSAGAWPKEDAARAYELCQQLEKHISRITAALTERLDKQTGS